MKSSVVYEVYAPVFYEDEDFTPQVTALVRDYLDKDKPKSAVISRLNGRMILPVSNSAVVFEDPRYYVGRLMAPASKHIPTKIARINENIRKTGLLNRFTDSVFELKLDNVLTTEIDTTTGKKTLIVAEQSVEQGETDTEFRDYVGEVVSAVNDGIQNRARLGEYEFNTLSNFVVIASLGSLASSAGVVQLTDNIRELVSSPLKAAIAIEDGLTTTTKIVS